MSDIDRRGTVRSRFEAQHAPDADLDKIDSSRGVERRKPALWITWAICALIAFEVLRFLVGNEKLNWPVVGQYLFSLPILEGLKWTIILTIVGMVLGVALGTIICLMRLSPYLPLRVIARVWINVFRSVPPLVQLLFWFNLAYLFPTLSLGIPFGPSLFEWNTNSVITPLTAAIIGLSLYTSPYAAEIIRGGLMSVPRGQLEAATSLGLSPTDTFFRIRLPQATRIILPPMGNQTIAMLKGTSLVSIISMSDLLGAARTIYGNNFEVVPLLLVTVIWYMVLTSILTALQGWLERRYSRGY